MENIKCRFCSKETQINEKCSCGSINTSFVPQNTDQNASFKDYSYNNYDSHSLRVLFNTWNYLNSLMFISNSFFLLPLKLFFAPILPVNFGIDLSKKKNLYDVGCGKGDFIRSLSSIIEVSGTDIVNYEIKDLNIKIMNFEKNKEFIEQEIVRSSHSLEHSINPKLFLDNLAKSVKSKGVLFISTPNSNFWLREYFGESWVPLKVSSHYCILNQKCIQEYLKTKGFTILKSGTYSNFSHLHSFFIKNNLKLSNSTFFIINILMYPLFILERIFNIGDSLYLYAEKN